MTDYAEEQRNEIEALESIYPNELKVLSVTPYHSFELMVSSRSTRDDVEEATCTLEFTYTTRYPDEAPVVGVKDVTGEDDCSIEILDLMKQLVEENLGMVMVFIIFSAVQEKLNEIVERAADEKLAEKKRQQDVLDDAERKKFEGTRVTIESFLAWQTKFDSEMAELRRLKTKQETGIKKFTGKELFMNSDAMDFSDVKFLEEGGEAVEVDESLFDDVDDLKLDDEDEGGDDDENGDS